MTRSVTRLPLSELWDDAGPVPATPARDLTADDIRELLRVSPVRFVVLNVGHPPRWVSVEECYRFWKGEVKRQLHVPGRNRLEDYPGEYFYTAAEWNAERGRPIVVLSMWH